MSEILIIGAGPTGLGAALRLEQLGRHDWMILEKEDIPGGLSATIMDKQGFAWDLGVHVPYSHYRYFDQLLDEAVLDWNPLSRENYILLGKRWIPCPFQGNIHYLSRDDQKRCLQGLVQRGRAVPANFQEWIEFNFGKGIGDLFLTPYNLKVWSYLLKDLSLDWVGDRIPTLDTPGNGASPVVDGADSFAWGADPKFRFPAQGGTGRIWREAAARLPQDRIRYRRQVKSIESSKKLVHTNLGTFPYEHLISSMPLDLLLEMLDEPVGVEQTEPLLHSSLHLAGVGIEGEPPESLRGKSWIYFPEPSTPFHRACVFSSFSRGHAPEGCWSLQFEISESSKKRLRGDPLRQSIDAAVGLGLIPAEGKIISRFHRRIEHAYPTPSLARNAFLEKVQPQLAARGILSRGRFGGWKYEAGNMDHSLMQGVEAADRIVFGVEEFTYSHPDLANSRKATTRSYSFAPDRSAKSRLMENIHADLLPWWEDGITRDLFERIKRIPWKGLHVKIVNGQLRIYKEVASVQTRNQAVTLMLKEVAARYPLPDCEFIIHTADIPLAPDLPLFTFCKRPKEKSILFPDHSFYSWLECLVSDFDQTKAAVARGQCTWEQKADKIFFSGAGTNPLRHSLARLKREFLEIHVSDWIKTRSSFVPLEDHNRWKYLLHLPGKAYSPRLKYLFLTNSLVIQGDSEWVEFWHPILEDGKDCVKHKFAGSGNVDRLYEQLSKMSDEECEQMVRSGREKVVRTLTLENIYEYIARLITEYSSLFRYTVQSQDYHLVIARYDEDISWSNGYPRMIYNKGKEIPGLADDEQIMLPNVGRSAHTYLTYIIENYDCLPDYVMFCQGRIKDHLGNLSIESFINPDYDFIAAKFHNLRTWDPTTGRLLHVGPTLERLKQGKMRPAKLTCLEWFEKVLDVRVGDSAVFNPGAIFCVSANKIRTRSIEFYTKLREYVGDHPEPEEVHYLERSWLYIFSDKDMKVLNLS